MAPPSVRVRSRSVRVRSRKDSHRQGRDRAGPVFLCLAEANHLTNRTDWQPTRTSGRRGAAARRLSPLPLHRPFGHGPASACWCGVRRSGSSIGKPYDKSAAVRERPTSQGSPMADGPVSDVLPGPQGILSVPRPIRHRSDNARTVLWNTALQTTAPAKHPGGYLRRS